VPLLRGTTRSWVKVKVRHESVFLVGGFRNVDSFDGVLVSEMVGGELRYRGIVEWGFRAADVPELLREARTPLRTSPFNDLRAMHALFGSSLCCRRGQLRGTCRWTTARAVAARTS
jgi:hypothetical protein